MSRPDGAAGRAGRGSPRSGFLRGQYVFYNQGSPVDLYYYTERDNEFDLARRGKKTAAQALKDLQSHVQDQLTKALAHYHG
jgi:predicted ArsR family transcriptional regulator